MSATDLRVRIDAVLHEFVEHEAGTLEEISPELKPIGTQLRAAVVDGKRLRGMFCYWGWRAAGQGDSDAAVRAAASTELVHAAALVHDDLIDDSPIRRGLPSAHLALRAAVSGNRNPDAAARALALLTGNLLIAWAGQLFISCGLPGAYLARTRPLWGIMARELIAGECLDVLRTGAQPGTAGALEVARYKTAKYTVEHPLQLGGRLGGACAALLGFFTGYGLPLGEAFQLRDDLLAVFGDSRVTGKSNLDDIAGAKPTTLIALALDAAVPAARAELLSLLGRRDLGTAELERLRSILDLTGARVQAETMIAERADMARRALAGVGLPRPASDALLELAGAVTDREY